MPKTSNGEVLYRIQFLKGLAIAQIRSQEHLRIIKKGKGTGLLEKIITLIEENRFQIAFNKLAQNFPQNHALNTLQKIIKLRFSLFPQKK
ncbi:MAG: hypothetical protein CMH63_03110 [Nanoarchaeota archaeon]|jgi:hypothetical protein|nr:hypothetical protein [Nanoarchaeota archaeon]|tara:strand:- start:2549 stop:2818 length:270 start_codon:yes stop_codon:yes gene_type:complete